MFKSILAELKKCSRQASIVDLNPFYKDSALMEKDFAKYFWEKDGHHTSTGYSEMARGTANALSF